MLRSAEQSNHHNGHAPPNHGYGKATVRNSTRLPTVTKAQILFSRLINHVRHFLPKGTSIRLARDIGFVSIGQLTAQIIAFAAIPVVTRLYDPHDIGIQGIFISLSALLISFSSLNFQTAIVLPKEDKEARGILRLTIYTSIVICLILEVLLFNTPDYLLKLMGAGDLIPYRHFIALTVILSSISGGFSSYFIRERLFATQAMLAVVNASSLNGARVGFGMIHPVGASLIIANVAAAILNLALYVFAWRSRFGGVISFARLREEANEMRKLFSRYRDFPLLRTPQVTINSISQFIPMWILAIYMGPSASGQYAIAISALGAPTALIGKAIGDAFYPRIVSSFHSGENLRQLVANATIFTILLVFVPYLSLVIFAPEIFSFVFGQKWAQAGEYARWLSVWSMLQLANRPAVAATSVLNIQGGLLIYELFSTGTKLFALWLGFYVLKDDIAAIALFSISGAVAYVCLIFWVIFRSGSAIEHRE